MKEENTTHPSVPDAIVLIHGLWMTPRSSEGCVEPRGNNIRDGVLPTLTDHSFSMTLPVRGLCDGL